MNGRFTDRWDLLLDRFDPDQSDVYYSEAYVRLSETTLDRAECFVYEDSGETYLIPYLVRPVAVLEGAASDVEAAYGYGGPVSTTTDPEFVDRAFSAWIDGCRGRDYIAAHIRFHPVLRNSDLVSSGCRVVFDRHTVGVDLTCSEDEIWEHESGSAHRRAIRKARREGLTFVVDSQMRYLDDFQRLYEQTMDRVGADEFYFFDDQYFRSVKTELQHQSILGVVLSGDEVAAAAIFLLHGPFAHFHLGGSAQAFLTARPNNLLFYEAALHFAREGRRVLHLGGGDGCGEDNSLYRFKRGLGSLTYDYRRGEVVFDTAGYEDACARWAASMTDEKSKYRNYFLRYRF